MNKTMKPIDLIEKEQLTALHFSTEPAVTDAYQRKLLQHDLNRALLLGNLYRSKVSLVFRTKQHKLHRVETTVWAVTENHVLLKGNRFLPINAILRIEF